MSFTLEEYSLLPASYRKTQCCAQCGCRFAELANIGQLACRTHPGMLMHDARDTRVRYYSCCGARYEPPEPICKPNAPVMRGCLLLDHHAKAFPRESSDARVTAIAAFATVALPALYMRLITQPLHDTMLFDSALGPPVKSLSLRFDALCAALTNESANLMDPWRPVVNLPRQPQSHPELVPTLALDTLRQEMRQRGCDAPLFRRLFERSPEYSRAQQRTYCQQMWRDDPGVMPDELDQAIEVPFCIVQRIGQALEYSF